MRWRIEKGDVLGWSPSVASFSHKIQNKYYGGHISVHIEGIALEHFSATTQPEMAFSLNNTHVMLCLTIFF